MSAALAQPFDYKGLAQRIVASLQEDLVTPPADAHVARRRQENAPLVLEVLAGCLAEDPAALVGVSMQLLTRYQTQAAEMQGGIEQLRAEVEEQVARWVAAESEVDSLRAELAEARAATAAAENREADAQLTAFFSGGEAETLRAQNERLSRELAEAREATAAAESRIEDLKRDLTWYRGDNGYESDWGGDEGNWEGNDGPDI